jgi:DNA-binding response OmpR family regulator
VPAHAGGQGSTPTMPSAGCSWPSRAVVRAGRKIDLQAKEFSLLEYFLRNAGRVLSKTMIMEHVWAYDFDPQTNVVDVLVCRLRNKIEKDTEKKLIHTLRGVGYALRIS